MTRISTMIPNRIGQICKVDSGAKIERFNQTSFSPKSDMEGKGYSLI